MSKTDTREFVQDFVPLVLRKSGSKSGSGSGSGSGSKPTQSHEAKVSSALANDFDPGNIKTTVVITPRELGLAIQQARMALKSRTDPTKTMTQTELNQLCGFPANTVKNYETCAAAIVPTQIDKLNRVLGVKLPRPDKAKK
jgi:hypothetical protein